MPKLSELTKQLKEFALNPAISDEEFLNAFEGVDVSAFTRIEEEGTLYLKPYTRNTFDWENVMQIEAFQMAWEFPSEPEVMLDACDKAQQVIEYMINQD